MKSLLSAVGGSAGTIMVDGDWSDREDKEDMSSSSAETTTTTTTTITNNGKASCGNNDFCLLQLQ
jgi:hypothetical protein